MRISDWSSDVCSSDLSEWGHDFRPDSRLLRPLLDHFPDVPRLALTATADAHTRPALLDQLGLPPDGLIVAGFIPPTIRSAIRPKCERPSCRDKVCTSV